MPDKESRIQAKGQRGCADGKATAVTTIASVYFSYLQNSFRFIEKFLSFDREVPWSLYPVSPCYSFPLNCRSTTLLTDKPTSIHQLLTRGLAFSTSMWLFLGLFFLSKSISRGHRPFSLHRLGGLEKYDSFMLIHLRLEELKASGLLLVLILNSLQTC